MLADCIKKVMTNGKEPVRLNLESIDELRNTGTHLVVEEYEITYGPIFQVNIHNYDDKLRDWHSIEICDSSGSRVYRRWNLQKSTARHPNEG